MPSFKKTLPSLRQIACPLSVLVKHIIFLIGKFFAMIYGIHTEKEDPI